MQRRGGVGRALGQRGLERSDGSAGMKKGVDHVGRQDTSQFWPRHGEH